MENIIGRRVANFRQIHNVTIKDLATQTGLSTALISQLERGIGNPTISVLESLANVMDISVSDLVAHSIENGELIQREKDRKIISQNEDLKISSVLVDNAMNTSLSVLLLELRPHCCSGLPQRHSEEESLCVLNGEMTMCFGDTGEEFLLHAGDSIRILPNRLHVIRNDSDTAATAMNIKCRIKY